MFTKICPDCKTKSYSSSEHGPWYCPHCNADITAIAAQFGTVTEDAPDGKRADEENQD